MPVANPLESAIGIPVQSAGAPISVKIKKPGFFSAEYLATIPGKIQTALTFIAIISFLIALYIIYVLFTAFFKLINAIIKFFNGILKKLPFKIKPIPKIPKTLFELLFKSLPPLPAIF